MSGLEVDVAGRVGSFAVDVGFASEGGVTALFGHSGAGKTTVINMIGGLVRPRRGRIVVDGRVLFDAERRIDLPPHRRRLGHVFQEGRLLPHLSVRHNLLYGRWFSSARADARRFEEVVELLGVEALLARRPRSLSGGERQRVAIGRALLSAPSALLMDEPLASLDAPRKAEILPYLERLRDHARLPIVYVSHAIDEVAQLARIMVLMSEGRVVASRPGRGHHEPPRPATDDRPLRGGRGGRGDRARARPDLSAQHGLDRQAEPGRAAPRGRAGRTRAPAHSRA